MLSAAFIFGALAAGALAQDTTITALVGSATSGYAASIVTASPCGDTVLALACTAGAGGVCAYASDITLTVTQGPSLYAIDYRTSTGGAEVTVKESCDLQGPSNSWTQAACTVEFGISAGGQSTTSSTTSTLSGSEVVVGPIPVTAGASNLPSSGAACPSGSGTASSGGAAAPTGIAHVYKVIVPVLVAGAGALI